MTNTSSHEWGFDHLNSFPYIIEPYNLIFPGPYVQNIMKNDKYK